MCSRAGGGGRSVLPHPHVVELDRIPVRRRPRVPGSWSGCTPRACGRAWRRCRSSGLWPGSSRPCPARRLQVNIHHDVFDAGRPAARPGARRLPGGRRRPRRDRPAGSRLPRRRAALGLPGEPGRVGAAVPVRHPLGVAGSLPRPRHDRDRAELRLLRRAAAVPVLTGTTSPALTPDRCRTPCSTPTSAGRTGRLAREDRRRERTGVAAAHRRLYEQLLG